MVLTKSKRGGFQVKSVTIFLTDILRKSMPELMQARLTQPLVRDNGLHRPGTWDEALERVTAAFRKSSHPHGLRSVEGRVRKGQYFLPAFRK